MKKKEYTKPSINVVEIGDRQPLLAGSGEGGIEKMNQQYLFEEEEEEG